MAFSISTDGSMYIRQVCVHISRPYMLSMKEDYHIHCNYNDHSSPDLTVSNVVKQAQNMGLKVIAFAEHVRKTSDWIPKYLDEIERISSSSSSDNTIKVIPGFEAKILIDGSIDCLEKYAEKYFVIASFHTQYNDKQVWLHALEKAIENPNVDVIGHIAPEPSFTLEPKEIEQLSNLIVQNKKTVELNAKYHRPPIDWIKILRKDKVHFHLGSDAHSLDQIGRFEKISDLIELAEGSD
jgi:histidinol phosphatase-like PHP family hydrolase